MVTLAHIERQQVTVNENLGDVGCLIVLFVVVGEHFKKSSVFKEMC